MPPPVPAGTPRTQETARAQRVSQAQYVEERNRNGIPPVTGSEVATLLTQLETMQALPGMSLSITAEVAGYRRTIVCQNNAWDGYDLTHQFLDERSTTVYGPSEGNVFEREASLKMKPLNPVTPQLPSTQTVSYQPLIPKPTQVTPSYAGSPAFGTPHGMPSIVMQTTSRAPIPDNEPSWSRLPPLTNPDLTGRSPS